jgi:hypothetical protein
MKSKCFVGFGIFWFFLSSGLYAQSSSIEQQLIGSTWVRKNLIISEGEIISIPGLPGLFILVFNRDGTYSTGVDNARPEPTGKWAISANRIIAIPENFAEFVEVIEPADVFISPGGKTLVLYYQKGGFMVYEKK